MTLERFIEENRDELKRVINKALNHVPKEASCDCPRSRTEHDHEDGRDLDDEDLRLWILNDEGLYRWARSEGMREEGDEEEGDND